MPLPSIDHLPDTPIALKIAVSVGIGMLIGMEREWSNKDVGVRTFGLIALLGMLSTLISTDLSVMAFIGVFLLIAVANVRSMWVDRSLELTTSSALMVTYVLGLLVGLGHIFTPVAGALITTMLLAWKTQLNKFAGELKLDEIRSAILLGLIGFVIYPILPNRYIDPWGLFNPSDAWISVIAIAGIGFINYVLLRIYSTKGLYLGAIFGGLVNSTATVAEVSNRVKNGKMEERATTLCLLVTIAMFFRNLIIATIFSPDSLTATLLPLLAMSLVAGLWIWLDMRKTKIQPQVGGSLALDSPISLPKVLRFGGLFILIQIGGTLLTQVFGSLGILATGVFGGLVSSASTTAAASTMAMHGKITPSLAGSVTVLTSLASALINLPIVWRTLQNRAVTQRLTIEVLSVLVVGILAVTLDRIYHISELFLQHIK
jgi:uncharacterized membrane protein (DUF4010 family)